MQNSEKKLSTVINDLEKERENSVKNTLSSLSPYEIARLLESIEPKRREVLWQLIDQDDEGEVLKELVEDVRQNIIEEMDAEELIAATQDLELDDLADILNDLPNQITDQVIKALDQEDQVRLESVISFEEDTAGGLTNPNILTIRRGISINGLIRYLRSLEQLPSNTNYIYVINRHNEYLGLSLIHI